jgi:hypothetical protein
VMDASPVRLFVVAALVVGFLGPCVCPLAAAAPNPAVHDCCGAEAGLKPAPADCCAGCSTLLRGQDSALLRDAPLPASLAPTSGLAEPFLRPIALPRAARLTSLVVPTPPNILRV